MINNWVARIVVTLDLTSLAGSIPSFLEAGECIHQHRYDHIWTDDALSYAVIPVMIGSSQTLRQRMRAITGIFGFVL